MVEINPFGPIQSHGNIDMDGRRLSGIGAERGGGAKLRPRVRRHNAAAKRGVGLAQEETRIQVISCYRRRIVGAYCWSILSRKNTVEPVLWGVVACQVSVPLAVPVFVSATLAVDQWTRSVEISTA